MKIKSISLAILALSFSFLTSCKDEKKETPANSNVELQENSSTSVALNPEHGLPGHRCEIPVGAPLNQAASTNTVQQSNPTISSDVSPVWANKPAPVKNPPHGQPGHDCAVPVGADLKR